MTKHHPNCDREPGDCDIYECGGFDAGFAEGATSRQAEIDYRAVNEATLSQAWQYQRDRAEAAEAKLAEASARIVSQAKEISELKAQLSECQDNLLGMSQRDAIGERVLQAEIDELKAKLAKIESTKGSQK